MIDALLHPTSIAVIGVSKEPQKVGHQIFLNLQQFPHPVIPIHPTHRKILGKKAYSSILSVPTSIDLAIITTPRATVEDIVHQCVDKKVRAIIIISAGFAETNKSGQRIQERIAQLCARHNILLLGPNTLGAINPRLKLNASFAPTHVPAGDIAVISQSGAMLTTIFSQLVSRNIGSSFAVSLGNSAGITVLDALDHALHDSHTAMIALYLESIPNIPSFFAKCKEISKQKPILLLKGGTTSQGQRASLSHTAALATDHRLILEGQHQFGYTCVETLEQFFETTFFLHALLRKEKSDASLPKNLLIVTNAGGPGVNATDLASHADLELATWSPASVRAFARSVPRITPHNPTDLLGDASCNDVQTVLEISQEDPLIDSILLILTRQSVTDIPAITQTIIDLYPKLRTPLIVALMGGKEEQRYLQKLRQAGITTVEYPNEGVDIYSCVNHVRRAQLVDRSAKLMDELKLSLSGYLPSEPERKKFPLQTNELSSVYLLLEAYGFTLPRAAIVKSSSQLDELDALDPQKVFPLFAKTANLKLKHKAVLGAVMGNIQNKEEAVQAFERLKKFGPSVLFQEVITDASEVILGYRDDPEFGKFIAVGMGGSLTNILEDRAYVFLPASSKEIRNTFRRTKLHSLMSTEQRSLILLCIERLMSLALEHPEIAELEINPLMLANHQAYVTDVKVELQSPDLT
ncbi:acetate--CoA ligase family protein [Candidatus Woesebacteria bacterium]|nr:acetate--CoA ligase family protein [Candidatus Woesebacteria bacterium]